MRTIIARYYSAWSAGRKLRVDVLRAASAIINCRTEHLGSHLESCDCGHVSRVEFNSCRHRSCPQCRGGRRADWLQQMTKDLLPCDHAHIIFTVPEQLNVLWQFNRALFADRLMTAARESLDQLLADPKYLGAKPGIISALHTWGRNFSIHPHGVSVAGYLARYMAGGPISDKRICAVTDSAVVFRYRDGVEKRMKLPPQEFLRRWFEHVPPRGLRMICRSGLYANCSRAARQAICAQLESTSPAVSVAEPRAAAAPVCALDPERCPRSNTCVTVRSVYHPPLVFDPVSPVAGRQFGFARPP